MIPWESLGRHTRLFALSPNSCQDHRESVSSARLGVRAMSNSELVVVGIDVSKATLDVFVLPSALTARFANEPAGLDALLLWLQPVAPFLVVMEATGSYHTAAATLLQAHSE